MIFVAYAKMPAREAEHPALLRVNISFVKEQHPHAGIDEECSEHVHDP
jgi:hypothetical protein